MQMKGGTFQFIQMLIILYRGINRLTLIHFQLIHFTMSLFDILIYLT